MIGAFLMSVQASAMAVPADWRALPLLPLHDSREQPPQLARFVHDEVLAGRCTIDVAGRTLELAVLVASNGQVRRIVPQAIGCATVEQYAAGVVLRLARDNLAAPPVDTWFRTTIALPRP